MTSASLFLTLTGIRLWRVSAAGKRRRVKKRMTRLLLAGHHATPPLPIDGHAYRLRRRRRRTK